MNAFDFRSRFAAAIGEVPKWLDHELCEFVTFERHVLERIPLRTEDVAFLSDIGMPRSSAPMLDFCARGVDELDDLREDFRIPDSYFPIGNNNSGDFICVGGGTGDVVCFEHDANPPRKVFINTSLLQFAESLCVYQGLLVARRPFEIPHALLKIDPPAMQAGTMWRVECDGLPRTANG